MVGTLVSWIGLCGLIAAAFQLADSHLRPNYRTALSQWLQGDTRASDSWPNVVADVFDWVFRTRGPKSVLGVPLYLPSFGRAALSSLVAVIALTGLWFALLPDTARLEFSHSGPLELWGMEFSIPTTIGYSSYTIIDGEQVYFRGKQPVFAIFLYPILFNFILDYLSLVETRAVLGLMSRRGSRVASLIGLDLLLTVCAVVVVGYLSIILGALAFDTILGASAQRVAFANQDLVIDFAYSPLVYFRLLPPEFVEYQATYARQLTGIYGIFIYSTFLTSLWIWLFLASCLVVRAIKTVPVVLRFVNRVFDMDQKISDRPLSLMGWILILVVTGIIALWRLVRVI